MRGGRDLRFVDIGRRQVLRGAEIGVHGALAVRRHQDVGAAGGGAIGAGLVSKATPAARMSWV